MNNNLIISYWHSHSKFCLQKKKNHMQVNVLTLWDVKEPTHYSKRVGDIVPGVVVYLHLHHHSSQVGRVQWAHTV